MGEQLSKTLNKFENIFEMLSVASHTATQPLKSSTTTSTYTLYEVGSHCYADDCWVVIYDDVYDLTDFLSEHPGGMEILLENAGTDATLAFQGHSRRAIHMLTKYKKGTLVEGERLYSRLGQSLLG